jgi:hypothetical protein
MNHRARDQSVSVKNITHFNWIYDQITKNYVIDSCLLMYC